MEQNIDPKKMFSAPPFDTPYQDYPGTENKMEPKADHGEESYVGYGRFKDRKVIVTGGDSGIGKAVAIAFAREGADVLISYLSDEEDEDAEDTASFVRKAGRKAMLMKGDITSEKHCKAIVDNAVAEFGHIDVLINNAAFHISRKSIEDIPTYEWNLTFDTNVNALFYLCKAAVPHMPKGSSIINTTSVVAFDPSEDLLPYSATKSAVVNLTANLSQILLKQDKGIRVNAVAPGPVWTPLIPATKFNVENFGKNTAMERPGQPVEIAPAFLFLASADASFISGAVLPVTGGRITI
ncbi:SDR family oxidoreductase [Pedobacter sp. SL55]|uniref:SDR family oxidoreductase n=1 Tax=Pedobacter sp. SL55 TaxID=2995161 RepID=UPI00226E4150|nr:SDR family oxidoreductase [Pedobacter sp. SL55]WAC40170.1 SDR family oxidoreductase [Pedobacter sp. SL55]